MNATQLFRATTAPTSATDYPPLQQQQQQPFPITRTNLYEPRTMQNEPNFILFYYIDLPIFVMGTLFNGYILQTILRNYSRLVRDRLDRCVTLLIGTYFTWSVAATVQYSVWLFHASSWFYRLSAMSTSMQILLVFGANTLMALERFFLIRDYSVHQTSKHISGVIVYIGVMCGIIVAVFVSSPSHDAIWPAHPVEQTIWTVTMLLSFIVMSVSIAVLYTLTFRYSSKMLREAFDTMKMTAGSDAIVHPQRASISHLQLQRKILSKCFLMFGIVFFSYAPEALSFVLVRTLKLNQWEQPIFWFQTVSRVLLVLDVLVSPAFVLYFMTDIRRAVLDG
ncbi:hypothetical protein BJ741DRAFT_588693 [Chytriomyces cf. hyalinus JEL632]|nr:hypothetical protein BJ741DRAFT_588693 [Chytriomyces cf. hyalinus JEL632]